MSKCIKHIIFLTFILVIILPPLVNGYVYPTIGDDAAYHMSTIDMIDISNPNIQTLYMGELIVGYPMAILKHVIPINTQYLWFSYMSLIFIGFTLYFIVSKLVNSYAGIIALVLPIFGFSSILFQWYAGTVFNIINLGIMLFATYFAIKWMEFKKSYHFIFSILLFGLSLLFHVSGVYSLALIVGLVISYFAFKSSKPRFILTLFIFCVALALATIFNLSLAPFRQSLDYLTVFSVLISSIIGVLIVSINRRKFTVAVFGIVFVIISIPLYQWLFNYNSAITKTDLQAVEYVNSLDSQYYSCSPEVAYWVYDRFIDKEYKDGSLPYIDRNEPMTNKTMATSNDYWFIGKQLTDLSEYDNRWVRYFKDGSLEISVYIP